MKLSVLVLSCCLFVVFSVFTTLDRKAVARVTDEIIQVNEGICDELIGGTPGLFGLCVAFHAHDCEPDFSEEYPFAECKPSSVKILELYNKRKQPGDPEMPGIQKPCPCWTLEEIQNLQSPAFSSSLIC